MAASLFERAVAKNDDFGDYYLGVMLETGDGEAQDLPRAVRLEAASAAQGQALGQVELGRMYDAGIGVAADVNKAAAEWRLAAAQGNGQAQDLLRAHGMQ
jgi:TPR repeat protein